MGKITLINNIIPDSVIFTSFIFSLIYWKNIKQHRCLKLFPFYIIISFLADLTQYFGITKIVHSLPQNVFVLIEFLFFYNFFRCVLNQKKRKNILVILFLLFVFSTIIILFLINIKYEKNILYWLIRRPILEIFLIENILLVIPVLLYYKSLFNQPFIKNLPKDPVFLIMTGILFCFSISTPILVFIRSIHIYDKWAAFYLYMINPVGFIIMHTFFIKAFLNLKTDA